MNRTVLLESTPLAERDCFMVFSRVKDRFTYPLHIHTEFELNFIENGKGAQRVVGDSIEEIDDLELTLITGPELEHAWQNGNCRSTEIKEITIQFHGNLMNESLLLKNQFSSVKTMFERAVYGLTFSKETILGIKDRLYNLSTQNNGAHSVLVLFGILYDLSISTSRELSNRSFSKTSMQFDSRRIEKSRAYIEENYESEIKLSDVANLIGMTEGGFSRFLRKQTGRSFIDTLNEVRLGHATRMLLDTTHSVGEVALSCGFNNLSNFNRIFKKKRNCTPTEFRRNYKRTKILL